MTLRRIRCVSSLGEEGLDGLEGLLLGLVEAVVEDDAVELRCEAQFVFGACDATVDHLGCVCGSGVESSAQFFHRWRLDEDAQCSLSVKPLDVAAAEHVDVEEHVLPLFQLPFYLRGECAVESVFVHLFVLEKFAGLDAATKFFGREEEVFHAVLFVSARRSAGAGDGEGESQLGMLFHQPADDGAFTRARGGREDDATPWGGWLV